MPSFVPPPQELREIPQCVYRPEVIVQIVVQGIAWFLVQLKSRAPLLPVGEIQEPTWFPIMVMAAPAATTTVIITTPVRSWNVVVVLSTMQRCSRVVAAIQAAAMT